MPNEKRFTVALDDYPDLVVILLGMRAKSLRGMGTILRLGPAIRRSVEARPDGLLLHENLFFGLAPLHVGMRQYWRDIESLERYSRALPHQAWWVNFRRDDGGTTFWHETYCRTGGFEAIYDTVDRPVGLSAFAPVVRARGVLGRARRRLDPAAPVLESPVPDSADGRS